jgi:rhodanese-related sulfurtransferase
MPRLTGSLNSRRRTEDIQLKLSRRVLLFSATAGTVAIVHRGALAAESLTAAEAHRKATAGEIILIDIRRPDEWAETGTGVGARRLDMRRDDFLTALDKLVGGNRSKSVALICARGVRSGRLSRLLNAAGFSNIIDVPEGMMGSRAGAGWVAQGLPLVK